jgi:glycerol-3-phosphate dehydrogenase (NAD(P)+)
VRALARIGILGAGGWGTALSLLLHRNGHEVALWEFRPDVAVVLDRSRQNPDFLPGITIPDGIRITSDLDSVVSRKDVLLITLPSHVVGSVARSIPADRIGDAVIVSASKGIENDSLLRMSQVLAERIRGLMPGRIVALSGPSHAEEVSRGMPTVVVAASSSEASSRKVQDIFRSPDFRLYTSSDVIGVELGGSFKNIIAIAAGISDGVGFGDNTKAAIMIRGIVEMTRLGEAMGADPKTFAGLSGMGDLIVTCTSRHSRNRHVGEQVGGGKSLDEVLDGMKMVAEGVRTTRSAMDLARKHGVDMPITSEVYEILFNGKNPKKAVTDLMTRDPKAEA